MVTPSGSFMAEVAVTPDTDEVVGAITASMEIENQNEDCDMLRFEWGWDSRYLVYILTIGVTARYRRHGIARVLLGKLLRKAAKYDKCKAIYLHVLATNAPAIRFYEQYGFTRLRELPQYYRFDGDRHDALLYIHYQHGGCPPRSWAEVKEDLLLRPLRRHTPAYLTPLLSSSSSTLHHHHLRRVDRVLRSPVTIVCLIALPLLFLLLCIYLSRQSST